MGSAPGPDRTAFAAGPSLASADPKQAGTDPTRRRVVDHLLGPVADILDLGGDAVVALSTTVGAALSAALSNPPPTEPSSLLAGGKVAVRSLRLVSPTGDRSD